MRKIILMTSAAILAPLSAIAQTPTCTATPDCASLGYTESSCPNGGVKCPWGDTWFCATSETELCQKLGYSLTCTGTGYSSGAGEACGGLYKECVCDNTADWNGSSCVCKSEYKYTCTNANESPSGTACGGKYASCSCSSGYEWNGSSCTQQCEYKGTLTSCPSPFTCQYEECSNLYYKTGCLYGHGYEWDARTETCTCENKGTLTSCPWPYSCKFENCSGKYYKTGCERNSGYEWNGSTCISICSYPLEWDSGDSVCACPYYFKYSCNGSHEYPSGTSCNGKYSDCTCADGYYWICGSCSDTYYTGGCGD